MKITLLEDAFYFKTECTACGLWDRPGEPAFFVDGNLAEWICDNCVLAGEDHIRSMFAKKAEHLVRQARAYEEASREEIVISEVEVRRAKDQMDRMREEFDAALLRNLHSDTADEIPF